MRQIKFIKLCSTQKESNSNGDDSISHPEFEIVRDKDGNEIIQLKYVSTCVFVYKHICLYI